MTGVEDRFDQIRRVEVGVKQLGNVKKYLDEVAGTVPAFADEFQAADKALRTGGDGGHSALGSEAIDVVHDMHAQITSMLRVVDDNLTALAAGMRKTADAVAVLAAKHKSAEERNDLAATALQKLLDT
jgi:hypothetical protein